MNDVERLFKGIIDSIKEVIEPKKPAANKTETSCGMNKKKIEVELPEPPSAGGFAGCPSGDNEYDEALEKWRKEVNAVILNAIPRGYKLQASEVKEVKTVRHYAEIVVEKS